MPQQPNVAVPPPAANADQEPVPPPPVSPITPTLPPAHLPDATPQPPLPSPVTRPVFSYHAQPDQVAIPPPPPRLIDFDSNPDVLALRSAISVLQVQKKRAAADIQALSRAKDAALDDPDAFMRDLAAGRVKTANQADAPRPAAARRRSQKEDREGAAAADAEAESPPREWSSLPPPQEVVRCPPINWAQYAVVGDSLDKLHAEEVARPTQGMPASVGANGAYQFKGSGQREPYPGVAAPFAPGKDRLDRKPRGKK
ncbi:hypothetical protein CDD83_1585 [Cordyceps sp. RAO-2017]|nr:hypothetical protein CDD83_1585 [Cordyceps sp. RAO-2017]